MRKKYHVQPGTRFGKLVTVEQVESSSNGSERWRCRCDCGRETKSTALSLCCGLSTKCRSCASTKPGSVLRRMYGKYKGGAIKRGLTFTLDLTEFRVTVTMNCHYCGAAPTTDIWNSEEGFAGPQPVNGVDRVDSSEGYIAGNVVACCRACNDMKGTMGQRAFIKHCQQIAGFQESKRGN